MGPSKHSLLSPSASSRWLVCTPSAVLESKMPNDGTDYAAEGTLAHTVAAAYASYMMGKITQGDKETIIKDCRGDNLWDDEMLSYAQLYSDYLFENVPLMSSGFFEVELEELPLEPYVPKAWGTCDFVCLSNNELHVVDYKYGKGVAVSATENTQLKLYALGALTRLSDTPGQALNAANCTTVVLHIVQPRIGEPTSYTLTAGELLNWGDEYVKPRAILAYEGRGDYAPSAQTCKFCRAKAICKGLAADVFSSVKDQPSVDTLTIDEAAEALKQADVIRLWLSSLEDYVRGTLLSGQTVKGWKLVEGRSNRKICDNTVAAQRLLNAGYTPEHIYKSTLLGITELEKLVGKKDLPGILGDVLVKPAGAPTLVVDTDTRPAMALEAATLAEFDKVTL